MLARRVSRACLGAFAGAALGFSAAAAANPDPATAQVMAGMVSFDVPGVGVLHVTNSPGAVIHWPGGFSNGPGELIRFIQQSAASAVLNRDVSGDPSVFLGALESNGRVFVINRNGILFGAGSTVDVAGLIASTLDLGDTDFLDGDLNFAQVGDGAPITLAGTAIRASGDVWLFARRIDMDAASRIALDDGAAALVAATEVVVTDAAFPGSFQVTTGPGNELDLLGEIVIERGSAGLWADMIAFGGLLQAPGGEVVLTAGNTSLAGDVDADSLTVSPSGATGGRFAGFSSVSTVRSFLAGIPRFSGFSGCSNLVIDSGVLDTAVVGGSGSNANILLDAVNRGGPTVVVPDFSGGYTTSGSVSVAFFGGATDIYSSGSSIGGVTITAVGTGGTTGGFSSVVLGAQAQAVMRPAPALASIVSLARSGTAGGGPCGSPGVTLTLSGVQPVITTTALGNNRALRPAIGTLDAGRAVARWSGLNGGLITTTGAAPAGGPPPAVINNLLGDDFALIEGLPAAARAAYFREEARMQLAQAADYAGWRARLAGMDAHTRGEYLASLHGR